MKKQIQRPLSILLPALVIVNLSLVFLVISPVFLTGSEQQNPEYFADQQKETVTEHVKSLDSFYSRIQSVSDSINSYTEQIFSNNPGTTRPSYYHNTTIGVSPPNLIFSEKHGQLVSYDVSSYKIAPSAYNNETEFNNNDEATTFGNWSTQIDDVIDLTSNLDLILIPMYSSMDEILWTYIGFENGVHRTYPFHNLPKAYDPRLRPWYTDSLDVPAGKFVFSTPYVDAATGKVIITASQSIFDNTNSRIGVIGIDFYLDTIQREVLAGNSKDFGRQFLVTSDSFMLSHPSYKLPDSEWTSTDLDESILNDDYETSSQDLSDLIEETKTSSQPVQGLIDYGGSKGDQLVTLMKLNSTSLIFGIALDYSNLTATTFVSGFSFDFILLFILLDILLLIGVFFGENIITSIKSQTSIKSYYDRRTQPHPQTSYPKDEKTSQLTIRSFKEKPKSKLSVNDQKAILFGVSQIIPTTNDFISDQFLKIFSKRRSLMYSELNEELRDVVDENFIFYLKKIDTIGGNINNIDFDVLF
ncbi:MAG: PDC sensor domain-containing protein, partial [Candidatus Kariarchaeaceae archaeon]